MWCSISKRDISILVVLFATRLVADEVLRCGIGEENIHRGLSGAAYYNEYGRREDSFQYLNNIATVLAAAISYSSYEGRNCRMEFF